MIGFLISVKDTKVVRHWWGSGNLDRCHRTIRSAPGSIPGQCIFFGHILVIFLSSPVARSWRSSTSTVPAMTNFRQVVGFIVSCVAFVYLLLYLRKDRNDLPLSLPGDVPGHRIQHSTRIVAVGDLHGDIGNAQKVLKMARVVDSDGMWSGEVDIFVQTGDIIDRCVYAR